MNPELEKAQRTIAELFNKKPKDGIAEISRICAEQGIDKDEQIAEFFHAQRRNLNLVEVGDYLGDGNNKEVLEHFRKKIDLSGQSFTQGLRGFLKTFQLPGEAQKIDRLIEAFSKTYSEQNSEVTKDAIYVLAFATIMLATDLHNTSIKAEKKMTLKQFQNNLRGVNGGKDFDPEVLKGIYSEIRKEKLEVVFSKVSPGYELNSADLRTDETFKKLDLLLKSSQSENQIVQKVFPDIGDNVSAQLTKPKSFVSKLTGYEGTITLTDEKTQAKVTVQIYKPNVFSKYLFGDKPKTIIQPVVEKGQEGSLDLAAKIAASFSSPISTIKATYDYEKTDMQKNYDKQLALSGIAESLKPHVAIGQPQSKSQHRVSTIKSGPDLGRHT